MSTLSELMCAIITHYIADSIDTLLGYSQSHNLVETDSASNRVIAHKSLILALSHKALGIASVL